MKERKVRNLLILLLITACSVIYSGWSFSQIAFACSGTILAIFFFSEILSRLPVVGINKYKTSEGFEYELLPFNDAAAIELMRIRSDLIKIQVKQDNKGWDKISNEFLQMFWTYKDYPSAFLCAYIECPEDCKNYKEYQGKIIIVLGKNININDRGEVAFDSEKLRKINTDITHEIKSGMDFSVFISDSLDGSNLSTYSRKAKILKITSERDDCESHNYMTLEINMTTSIDFFNWNREEDIKIIRKIKVYNNKLYHFIVDENVGI